MTAIPRPIIGFHRDANGDWVAELSCGHGQHVRHKPPWQLRPWVLTEEGRQQKMGTSLHCANCGMPALPPGLECYKSTPEFSETTVPSGLLRSHSLKADVWGRILVREGRLLYVIERDPEESFVIGSEVPGIISPELAHHIEPCGHVRFCVEFLKATADAED